MENEILEKMREQDAKLEAIFVSVEKTRKYFLVTMWATIIVFVLPLVAMIFVIPAFINSYLSTFDGLL